MGGGHLLPGVDVGAVEVVLIVREVPGGRAVRPIQIQPATGCSACCRQWNACRTRCPATRVENPLASSSGGRGGGSGKHSRCAMSGEGRRALDVEGQQRRGGGEEEPCACVLLFGRGGGTHQRGGAPR